ncbi:TetR/AcrR family transcriptional regulator [Archangium primigenium]|uniref:TetR/AcrR family transcriptional regulator n=1 Tax=[Archangium] primigenium TaxID=2792470 RepID=UPI00195C470E|nr:TetR/AcrR family transcriptional regulator [Archangium primigenium]MBM7112430.1 TetR/AcrR family transcriptional regulator [Archangium primigenium]
MADVSGEDSRRRALLDTAMGVFVRHGYRKTSMDEVARAAQISRQGLYLHFSTKEELFRASIRQFLDSTLRTASAVLEDATLPLDTRLARALDEGYGRFAGKANPDALDLVEASHALLGTLVEEHEDLFAEALARALRASRGMSAYKPVGLTARQLADTLVVTATGLKHRVATRDEFIKGITVAVRALCLPLLEVS